MWRICMLILGLKWLRRRGNGGIRTSPVLNFKTHGLCRYFTTFWAFHLKLKLLQAFKPLWRSFMDVFGNGAWGGGGEEANIRPFPVVLGNFWATFWRLEQLFAVLATSSKLAFLSKFQFMGMSWMFINFFIIFLFFLISFFWIKNS